jgi:exopolyphosphatase/guanosine-5'-triphosphate,3'-diphosphate pyrophosphatase
MSSSRYRLAAIDLGTNSFHLVVASVDRVTGRFRILDREKELVRLGSGSNNMKYLSEAAMTRAITTLKRFKSVADAAHARIVAVATSAVREALNQDDFLRRVKAQTDITVQVVSDVEEARLIYLGVLQALPVFEQRILLIDIGGGSTEFLVGKRRVVHFKSSLKLGAVRLTEKFFSGGVKKSKAIAQAREFIHGSLAPIARQLNLLEVDTVVGTSGTIANLAAIVRASKGRRTTSLNNVEVRSEELIRAAERIAKCKNSSDLLEIRGLDRERADIILAGSLILERILLDLSIERLVISEYALREGILFDAIEKEQRTDGGRRLHNIRLESVLHLGDTLSYERNHAHQVARLALRIFDQTRRLHSLGRLEREFLEAAALLHEVGLFVSHSQHHRHSYYLIRHADLLGYTENEKEMIATIARYHRKSHPKEKHDGFARLSQDEQRVVTKLAAILRIADGLDRRHIGSVKDVRCLRKGKTLLLRVVPEGRTSLELEIWGSDRKKQLFEETFRTEVRFKAG